MPIPLILAIGAVLAGAGVLGYRVYEKQKELEWKKSYAECVKTLAEKYNMPPQQASQLCKFEDYKIDLVNLALLGATISATLIGAKILLEGLQWHKQEVSKEIKTKA
jgi:predicted negative regulator of RcsB-dependent stress response